MNLEEIHRNFQKAQDEIVSFFKEIPQETFFSNPPGGWSPAENIRHLTTSIVPVSLFLKKELHFLLQIFGKTSFSRSYSEIVRQYKKKLNEGSTAGVFSPFSLSFIRTREWQELECNTLSAALDQLIQVIPDWSEIEVDSTNIVHPILGTISVREMLYFSLYHLYHHSTIVEERLR